MTTQDILEEIIDNRTLTITSKKSLELSLPLVEDKTAFLETYLFGDDVTYSGIADIMGLLYHELFLLKGSVLQYPVTFDKAHWQAEFNLAVLNTSADSTELYPSGTQTLNVASPWITNNGYTVGTTGILGSDISAVISAISALTAKRTEDVLPHDGTADTPDYYSDPEAANLKSTTASLLADLITYQSHLTSYFSITTAIGTNPLFSNVPDMTGVVESSDEDNIQGLVATAISTLTGLVSYFDEYVSSSSTRATFNGKLTDLTNYLSAADTGLTVVLSDRYDTSEDSLSIDDIDTGLRKWFVFWLRLLIGKPRGSITSSQGIATAIALSVAELAQQRDTLDIFFEGTSLRATRYLSTPKCGVYTNEGKAILLLQTIPGYTQFKVYRKKLDPTASVDATQWTEDFCIKTETATVSVFTWEETLPVTSGWYAYRFSIQDTGTDQIDTYSTGSLQSDILGEELEFTGFIDMTVTSEKHGLSVGDVVFLETLDTSLVTTVESKTEDTVTLVGTRPSTAEVYYGTIRKLSCFLYVS